MNSPNPLPQLSSEARDLMTRAERLLAQGGHAQALALLDRALASDPGNVFAHCRRGLVLKEMRRLEEALRSFERAITLQPGLAPAHMDRGNILQDLGRLAAALAAYDRALALQPGFTAALCNRGTVLHRMGRLDEAIAAFDAALAIDPELIAADFNRATALNDAGRHAEALAGFERTLERYPRLAVAHWNEALCRLRLGDFRPGWKKFEWRWHHADLGLQPRAFERPVWLGRGEIAGRTLLVHAEQGLGDTIQFCRYVPLLAARGARVILELQRPLVRLLQGLAGVAQIVARGAPLPDFDFHTPLMSLPLAFDTTVDTIPARVPYLHPDPALARAWNAKLPPPRSRLRIGLAWSGNPKQPNDYNRSLPLSALRRLTALDAEFIAVQTDIRAVDAPQLGVQGIRSYAEDLGDFAETAALVANLDLVVSACTAPAHLAGALGIPVWIPLAHAADWRWLLAREDSPWYPSARLFRQTSPGNWGPVVDALADQLQLLIDANASAKAGTRAD